MGVCQCLGGLVLCRYLLIRSEPDRSEYQMGWRGVWA
jgi:hypothetical protein